MPKPKLIRWTRSINRGPYHDPVIFLEQNGKGRFFVNTSRGRNPVALGTPCLRFAGIGKTSLLQPNDFRQASSSEYSQRDTPPLPVIFFKERPGLYRGGHGKHLHRVRRDYLLSFLSGQWVCPRTRAGESTRAEVLNLHEARPSLFCKEAIK